MNIFILDLDPIKAAEYQCDKHVVKMIVESVQILCNCFDNAPYKRTHYNHPCCVWVRKSKENFEWLLQHTNALLKEYTKRYNKTHKSEQVYNWIIDNKNNLIFDNNGLTSFALAMPEQYRCADPVISYRNYYINDKKRFAKYKLNNYPNWLLY